MIYNDIEFHNVWQLEKKENRPGLKLQRFPEEVRNRLDTTRDLGERGGYVAQQATGCEIRFVTDAKTVRVTLSISGGEGDIIVLKGDYVHSIHRFQEGVIKTLQLEEPARFAEIKKEVLYDATFSPEVWRICSGRYEVTFYDIETFGKSVRAPKKDELPGLRWLAYGSSITQCAGSFTYYDSYVQQAARRMGVDVINLGTGGCCRCEEAVADFIAEREDWDFATLELGINMVGEFTPDEFRNRAEYLIKKAVEKNPGKHIFVITLYPSFFTYQNKESENVLREREYKQILRDIVGDINSDKLHIIEGSDILTKFSALSCDILHPSNFGHTIMGENLARKIAEIIKL